MKINTIKNTIKSVMLVYSAKDYNFVNPRLTKYVEVNIPEFTPTIPQDAGYERFNLTNHYFVNTNFPATSGSIITTHSVALPILRGTSCPVYFPKGTKFLLYTPTNDIENGYLMYV